MALPPVQPGDVLAVRTPPTLWGALIRFGAALQGKPNLDDHIVIVHRIQDGVTLGVEGRPGGVGWVDVARYDSPYVLTNVAQPKTPEQREQVAQLAMAMIGTPYDWAAIADDTLQALRLERQRVDDDYPATKAPGHVVCSSLAAWIYEQVGLDHPHVPARWTTPGDWAEWIIDDNWR